ncbi:MAG: haloacid dehalogenase type II [Candidatus Poribacteria bacterium]|nr:haloacid dehalogenase type II [Candidatus Poribacteria bacterium]
MKDLSSVKSLTFDLFGTILDLGGSLIPYINRFLDAHGAQLAGDKLWEQWRARQRIEQYQDTIMSLGHSGYLATVRRALVYTLYLNDIEPTNDLVSKLMSAWRELSPFPEVLPALEKLANRYKLVVLSNGDPEFLDHLTENRFSYVFDYVFSVNIVGAFKPHPGVYLRAASTLGLGTHQCLMVSANSFDIMGARACGFRAVFVNRYQLPYEDTDYQPDSIVSNFTQLTEFLLSD